MHVGAASAADKIDFYKCPLRPFTQRMKLPSREQESEHGRAHSSHRSKRSSQGTRIASTGLNSTSRKNSYDLFSDFVWDPYQTVPSPRSRQFSKLSSAIEKNASPPEKSDDHDEGISRKSIPKPAGKCW